MKGNNKLQNVYRINTIKLILRTIEIIIVFKHYALTSKSRCCKINFGSQKATFLYLPKIRSFSFKQKESKFFPRHQTHICFGSVKNRFNSLEAKL